MRILLYILIWTSLLFLPNRLLTTEYYHEYLGLVFLLLGGTHLFLVRRYLRALVTLRLRITPLNIVNTIMLSLLVIVIVTGILISLYATPIVRLRGTVSIYVHGTHLAAAVLFYLIVGILAGVHAFVTTHIYEKILFEHMSFGGVVGTWEYQLDLALIFAGCMSCSLFFERLRRRK